MALFRVVEICYTGLFRFLGAALSRPASAVQKLRKKKNKKKKRINLRK